VSNKCAFVIIARSAGCGAFLKIGGTFVVHHVFATVASMDVAVFVVVDDATPADTLEAMSVYAALIREHDNIAAIAEAVKLMPEDIENVMVLYGDMPLIKREVLLSMLGMLGGSEHLSVVTLSDGAAPASCDALVTHKGVLSNLLSDAARAQGSGKCLSRLMFSAVNKGLSIYCVNVDKPNMAARVTNNIELSAAEHLYQAGRRERYLKDGVFLVAPETVFFGFNNDISCGVTIHPYVVFGPNVTIESGAVIGSFSTLTECHVGQGAVVGPNAHVHEGVVLGSGAVVGNFVEIKRSSVGDGSKIKHLSYIGDSTLGQGVNVGAGAITCNYTVARTKESTVIGSGAFIGSNASLVAPVTIGDGAVVGAGSVITKDVPEDSVAVSRSPQRSLRRRGRGAKKAPE
jgi:bifunctional UDP-N-acetylglucosamine pyrophosphorylase/glucosamine-1-phosphate N-acetyltransferase